MKSHNVLQFVQSTAVFLMSFTVKQ